MSQLFGSIFRCKFTQLKRDSQIFREKHQEAVNAEDAAVADAAALARGKDFDVAPTSVKIVTQGYDVTQVKYRAVGFPN